MHTGFIAQEVHEAAKDINYDFHGVYAPINATDNYGLRYSEFTVPLVKAVQELSDENAKLKSEIIKLNERCQKFAEKIERLLAE